MFNYLRKTVFSAVVLATTAGIANAENVFRFAFQGDIQGLDPQSHYETFQLSTMSNVYEGLTTRDKNLQIRPNLAKSWKQISKTEWEFKLQKGVKFHDGSDFTAEDVAFTFERARQTDFKAAVSKVKGFKIIDDYTLIMITDGEQPGLVDEMDSLFIMDKGWAMKHGADVIDANSMDKAYTTNHANGTGPFKAVSYQAGVKTEFVRFKGYWNNANIKTNLDRVIFTPIGQDATRVAALLSGAVDMAYPIPVQDQKRLQSASDTSALVGPETRTIFLGFDMERAELVGSNVKGKNPFKDKRVREAFALAIDNNLINRKIMRGSAFPTSTMVAKVNAYPGDDVASVYPQNPEKAKKLLAQAGYPNGFTVKMDCPNNRYVNDEKICQAVVSMLAKVGVKVVLLAQPKAQYFKKVLAGGGYDTSFYLLGWAPGSKDALDPVEYLLSCRGKGDGLGVYNLGNYCNPKINALAAKARVESDAKKRTAILRQAYIVAKKDYGYVPIHNQSLSWGVNTTFSVVQRADNRLDWHYIVKK